MTQSFLFLFTIVFSFQAFSAGDRLMYQPDVQCPQTHEEVKSLITDIHALKVKFSTFECNEISSRFDNIEKILGGREEFLNLIFNNEGKSLSKENAEKIQNYSSSLTHEAGLLVALLSKTSKSGGFLGLGGGGGGCTLQEEDRWEATARVMGALYEGVSFISSVAGPYGVPIQIGAEILNGAIVGLAAFEKSSRRIDFSKSNSEKELGYDDGGFSKRALYENSVCLLVKTEAEAQRILNPKRHLQQLAFVKSKVEQSLNQMFGDCPDCKEIVLNRNGDSTEEYFGESEAVSEDEEEETELKELAVEEASNLLWLDEEIERYKGIVQNNSSGIGPSEALTDLELIKKFLYETATEEFLNYYMGRLKKFKNESNRNVVRLLRTFDREELPIIGEKIDHYASPEGFEEAVQEKYPEQVGQSVYGTNYNVQNEIQNFQTFFPAVYDLFLITNKSKYLNQYSRFTSSQIVNTVRDWQKVDLTQRLISEYCSFFFNLSEHTYETSIEHICESRYFINSEVASAYTGFYFAKLLSGEKRNYVEKEWGPIDFKLEEKRDRLADLEEHMPYDATFAKLGVNMAKLIREEKDSDIFDLDDLLEEKRGEAPYELWHEAAVSSFNSRLESFRAKNENEKSTGLRFNKLN